MTQGQFQRRKAPRSSRSFSTVIGKLLTKTDLRGTDLVSGSAHAGDMRLRAGFVEAWTINVSHKCRQSAVNSDFTTRCLHEWHRTVQRHSIRRV